MKSQLGSTSPYLLTLVCLILAIIPASAQVLYDNGPANGTVNGWLISSGYDGLSATSAGYTKQKPDGTASGNVAAKWNVAQGAAAIAFVAWESPGDKLTSVNWSFTSLVNSGTLYGSGTASGANLTDTFLSSNEYGYDIDAITITGLNVSLPDTTYWLNLQDAVSAQGNPVFWDENSGVGCKGNNGMGGGCPSQGYEGGVGTIPSEAFTIYGTTSETGTTPEPSSILLLGTGVLGLAGFLRRRLLG